MLFAKTGRALALAVSLFAPLWAFAGDESASSADSEFEAASQAAYGAAKQGPTAIPLRDQASLKLPEGFAYIPAAEAARMMRAMGNQTGPDFLGMVIGQSMSGFVTVDFEKSGYIKDDDAKDWNADELLDNLRDGTEQGNKNRRERGLPEFEVAGWVEKPAYDAGSHRLVWSAEVRDKMSDGSTDPNPGVNYNTYLLGREGYISMNLVTSLAEVEAQKPIAHELLSRLEFTEGKRYADFDSKTDNVAAYGLAALVGGMAAKKLGLLATMGLLLAKFWKIAAIALVAFGAGIKRFFTGKSAS